MRRSVASLPEYAQERQVTVQVGRLGGCDLRPSRLFFWLGRDRDRRQRIVSYGRPPKVLRKPRRRAYVHLGVIEISYLGNPVVTVPLSLSRGLRHLWQRRAVRRQRRAVRR